MSSLHLSISRESIFSISPQREGTSSLSSLVKALGWVTSCEVQAQAEDEQQSFCWVVSLTHPERILAGTARAACSPLHLQGCSTSMHFLLHIWQTQSKESLGVWLVSTFFMWFAEVLTIPSVFTNSVVLFKLLLTWRIQVLWKRKNMKRLCYRLVFCYYPAFKKVIKQNL